MVKCPECKKEISNPEMEFHIGRENTGNQFHYAVCSCPGWQNMPRDYGDIVKKTVFCSAEQNSVSIVSGPLV